MMQSLIDSRHAVTLVLADQNKPHLFLTRNENKDINNIINLLKPFKLCGEKLSSESNVTISLIIPMFQALKDHLTVLTNDTTMIESMKTFMLEKMKTRYTPQQMQFLTKCTVLDIRYKSCAYVSTAFDQLEKDVKEILEAEVQEQSQQSPAVIPATQGQELHNLSNLSNDNRSIFDFEDDDVLVESQNTTAIDTIKDEIKLYKSLTMSKHEKERCNVLQWWKEHKTTLPCLFKAAQSYLHIPATSVPSERIFSLAGYVVRDRRSRMLPGNVNKFIFLKKNKIHIPTETSIWTQDYSN